MIHGLRTTAAALATVLVCAAVAWPGDEPTPEQVRFFEKQIRPIFVERCHKCHGAEDYEGGLQLLSRETLERGGDNGPVVVPGKPDESTLIKAVKYEDLEMPPDGRLRQQEIAQLVKWVEMGAAWPSDDD